MINTLSEEKIYSQEMKELNLETGISHHGSLLIEINVEPELGLGVLCGLSFVQMVLIKSDTL